MSKSSLVAMKMTDGGKKRTHRTFKLCFFSTLVTSACLVVFVLVASNLRVKPPDFTAPAATTYPANITFAVEVVAADPTSRTLTMDWYLTGTFPCDGSAPRVADIYFDPGSLDSSSPSFASIPPFPPVYQYNITTDCTRIPYITPVFRTVFKLLSSQFKPSQSPARSSLQDYPFDVYFARFYLHALDADTGSYIPLNVSRSLGIAVNFEVTLDRAFVLGTASPQLFISLRVERSKAIKTFVVLVAITNWLITIVFLVICAATQIYPTHHHYTEIFVVPVGALFAFTSIRANLPGAPAGFGATIDLYSILPVLVVMALCSVFLLTVVLYRRVHEKCRDHPDSAVVTPLYSLKGIVEEVGLNHGDLACADGEREPLPPSTRVAV